MTEEKLVAYKSAQKESWGMFSPLEAVTTLPAATLVKFSGVKAGQHMLDVACGTGVVAITAAQLGLRVAAFDLSPVLVERAKENARIAQVEVDLREGDVEALPYPDAAFDAVLSQYGHMFAPRPAVAIGEMLRVLKPGGIIAFSTWPPDLYVGRFFNLVNAYFPVPEGISPSTLWGEPKFVREQVGNAVDNLIFDYDLMRFPALSFNHYRQFIEPTLGPVRKLIEATQTDQAKLNQFRRDWEALASQYYVDNYIHQHYLMTKAIKK